MDILSYTESPFARVPRLHHKDALDGPSSAGFARRNLVGMMGVMMAESVTPTDPYLGYVSNGLVAMWDGLVGAWKDVVGGRQMSFVGTHEVRSDCVYLDGVNGAYGIVTGFSGYGLPTTQEACISVSSAQSYGRIIAENAGLIVSSSSSCGRIYGFGKDATIGDTRMDSARHTHCATLPSGDMAHFWWDGVQKAGGTTMGTSGSYPTTLTFFNRSSGGRGITGELCNFRIYNRVLTAEEIAANAANDRLRFGF